MNDLEKSFDRMLEQTLQIVDRFNKQHKKGHDFGSGDLLFPSEIHTIQAIGDHENINITDLAAALKVTKPTISERVKKLERIDLIQRQEAADNMKTVILQLTARGWIAYKGHKSHHKKMFTHFQKQFGSNTAGQIRKCQQAFAAFLDVMKQK
jgi:DNA-binding MarR family transcriptional regulator